MSVIDTAPVQASSAARSEGARAKRETALRSVLAASGITLLKIITGISTGSLGMLSEAAHSSIDLLASIMTLVSVRVSDRPADEDHTYGHGRIESLSAFVETGFMLGSSVWIIYAAMHRIISFRHGAGVQIGVSAWPVLVLLLSIAVDWTRSRHMREVAHRVGSQALEADALHFSTDIWSSAAVLLGILAAYAGRHFQIRWLELADPMAAILVAGVILRVTLRLARETVDALLDRTPPEVRRNMVQAISGIEGVVSVERLRMRRAGTHHFADLTIAMPRNMTFQRSEQVVSVATGTIQNMLPGTDVVVHTVPVAADHESVFDRVRAVAQRANLSIHDVSVQQIDGSLTVELHLELPEHMLLREAHETVTRIEADMLREIPQVRTVVTHIESEETTIEQPVRLSMDAHLEEELRAAAARLPEIEDVHNVVVTRHGDRLQISCHVTLPDALEMGAVHRIISQMEARFLRGRPEVSRLLIHPEPATDNRR